jgi:hypothetical protein
MFSVESIIREDALLQTMGIMRTWLDHKRFEPATFRYTFVTGGIALRVVFTIESEAAAFARAFSGQVADLQSEAQL